MALTPMARHPHTHTRKQRRGRDSRSRSRERGREKENKDRSRGGRAEEKEKEKGKGEAAAPKPNILLGQEAAMTGRTGGVYIPPFKLAQMKAALEAQGVKPVRFGLCISIERSS